MSTRISPSRTSRRRRRDEPSRSSYALSGIATLALLALVSFLSLRAISDGVPGLRYQSYFASFADAGSLRTHDEIRIAGRRQGQVGKVTSRDGRALVELRMDPGINSLPSDTQALVRPRGLLGTRYVQVILGKSSRDLAPGEEIRAGAQAFSNGVPELLDTFDARTRAAAQGATGGFGGGLAGRGTSINRTLETLPRGSADLQRVADAVLHHGGAAQRLFPSLAAGSSALAGTDGSLAASFDPTSRALQPFIDTRALVYDTLAEAPPALSSADTGLQSGRELLAAARRLSVGARDALPIAPRALSATAALLRTSDAPLKRTVKLLSAAGKAVPPTLDITRSLKPMLAPLQGTMSNLLQPVVTLGRYGCDIKSMLANWRSTAGQGTPGGNASGIGGLTTFRLNIIAGPSSFTGITGRLPESVSKVTRDTYPAPCANGPQTYDPTGLDTGRTPGGSR